MRDLPSNAATEAAKLTGSYPIRVLEITLPDDSVLYLADREVALTSDITTVGTVKEWGSLRIEPEYGQVGGWGNLDVTVSDLTWFFLDNETAQPGLQTSRCNLYLWFSGTNWDNDKVLLFAGTMAPPDFAISQSEVKLTIRGLEEFWNKDVGWRITQQDFPTIRCNECDDQVIPLVFGRPARRIPLCPIVQPARSNLALPLSICDTTLQIVEEASLLGFPVGPSPEIQIVVGVAGDYDILTGYFDEYDETIFHISDRQSFAGRGVTAGIYTVGGLTWITLDKVDMDDSGVQDRRGYPVIFPDGHLNDASCIQSVITHWDAVPDPNELAFWPDNENNFPTSESPSNPSWIILNRLTIPDYPAGAEVVQVGEWVYAANFLPIEGVERIEVKGTIATQGFGQEKKEMDVFFRVSDYYYVVDENDTQFNTLLGRDPSDPGIATITMDTSPLQQGFKSDIIWVTLNGTKHLDNSPQHNPLHADLVVGEAIENPAAVIAEIASNPFLGNISDFQLDGLQDAFDNAQIVFAFAIQQQRGLWDILGDLAWQAGLLIYVDGGNIVVKEVLETKSPPDFTSDNDNRRKGSLTMKPRDVKEIPIQTIGNYWPSGGDEKQRIVRRSSEASDDIARAKSREFEFWAIQLPSNVAYMTEFMLAHELSRNRRFTFEQFLDFLAAQPGDILDLTHDVVDDTPALDEIVNTTGRIVSIEHLPANAQSGQMEVIRIQLEVYEWTYQVYEGPEPYECGVLRKQVDAPPDTVYIREARGFQPVAPPQLLDVTTASTVGGTSLLIGKSDGQILKDADDGVMIVYEESGGALQPTSDSITDILNPYEDIDDDRFMWIAPVGSIYVVVRAEC